MNSFLVLLAAAGTVMPGDLSGLTEREQAAYLAAEEAEEQESVSTVEEDVLHLLQMIERESPVLYRKIKNYPRRELLLNLLNLLNTGVRPATGEEMGKELASFFADGQKEQVYPGKLICGNRILYIRIDSVDQKTGKQMLQDLEGAARLSVKPEGVIADLRAASGTGYEIPGVLLKKLQTDRTLELYRTLPLLILTGSETTGAAELLTYQLKKLNHQVLVCGKTGSGKVFPVKRGKSGGRLWLVPEIPEKYADIPPLPCKPDLPLDPVPQIPYSKIADCMQSSSRDSCLKMAAELILTWHAMRGIR